MRDLNVTLVQSSLHWEAPARNLAHFDELLRSPEATDVIVLPEMFTTGFSMQASRLAESMDGPAVRWMAATAARTGAAVCGSLIIAEGGRHYNRFVWMPPGGEPVSYDKRHLFRLAGEHLHYTPGRSRCVLEYRGWRICPMICYDLRFPVWSRTRNDVDLLIYVANWPAPRAHAWQVLLRARAIENACYTAGVNRIGEDGAGLSYAGASAIVDYLGHELASPGAEAGVTSTTLDHARLADFRAKLPWHLDADEFSITL